MGPGFFRRRGARHLDAAERNGAAPPASLITFMSTHGVIAALPRQPRSRKRISRSRTHDEMADGYALRIRRRRIARRHVLGVTCSAARRRRHFVTATSKGKVQGMATSGAGVLQRLAWWRAASEIRKLENISSKLSSDGRLVWPPALKLRLIPHFISIISSMRTPSVQTHTYPSVCKPHDHTRRNKRTHKTPHNHTRAQGLGNAQSQKAEARGDGVRFVRLVRWLSSGFREAALESGATRRTLHNARAWRRSSVRELTPPRNDAAEDDAGPTPFDDAIAA